MYELIVIGGGPAGVAAGVYAARKKIKTLLITDSFGGQSLVSNDVQNWIGDISVSGFDLGKRMEAHLRAQESIEIVDSDIVTSIEENSDGFTLTTEKGNTYEAKSILLTSGSRRKKLGIPGEKEYESKGVFYCATCDAPMMGGRKAVVIGGGNSGLEAVRDLTGYAEKIYMLHRRDTLRGDAVTAQKLEKHPKVEFIYNALIQEIMGETMVNKIRYKDKESGEEKELEVEGVFVEIGARPNSEFVKDLVDRNEKDEVIVDHKTQASSRKGIWAAGDVSDVLYKQNNVSSGDAIKAVMNIHEHLGDL